MNDLFDYREPQRGPRIDRDIPIPMGRVKVQRIKWDAVKELMRATLSRLQVNDSIGIHPDLAPNADLIRIQNYVSGAACSYRAEQPKGSWAFTTRQMPDGTVRLWRIDPADQKGRGE